MTRQLPASRLLGFLALCSFGIATALAQPAPVTVVNTQTIMATVESIDLNERMVELRADEQSVTVQVPPEVRNLAQLKVGDKVVVQYHEALAAAFQKKGEGTAVGVIDATTGTSRAPAGKRPGAAVANKVTTTIVIESVDNPSHALTFTGPSGMTRTVSVKDPRAQEFISKLKQGDEVQLTYFEALAVTVDPQPR
jgi:hypothetical protein